VACNLDEVGLGEDRSGGNDCISADLREGLEAATATPSPGFDSARLLT
jgi:hypothetical protein